MRVLRRQRQAPMRHTRFANAALLFTVLSASQIASAQSLLPDAPVPVIEPPATAPVQVAAAETPHTFWDTQNRILFSAALVTNAADFAVTRKNLQDGGRELDPLVRLFGRSTLGLALKFASETASVMSLSYLFHKTGHHKLERMAPVVNIGTSGGGLVFGLTRH